MKKIAALTMCGIMAASLMAVPALADTTITLMASQDWVKDAEQELGKQFEEETGIHVDYQIVPADQYQDLLLTRLNSGEGPDIFGAQSGFALATTYHVQDNAVDLSDEPWMDAYSVFSAEQTSVDGVNYGLTYFDTTTDYYMIYNKKLFEAAGITEGMDPADVCEAMIAVMPTITVEGLTGTMQWDASGAVTKTPMAAVIENGVYVVFEN